VLHALHPDQAVGDRLDVPGLTAHDQDFKAIVLIEMNVIGADNCIVVVVLQMVEPVAQLPGLMAVYKGYRADHLPVALVRQFLDQGIPDQVPYRFRPVGETLTLNLAVESSQQLIFNCDTESHKLTHGSTNPTDVAQKSQARIPILNRQERKRAVV